MNKKQISINASCSERIHKSFPQKLKASDFLQKNAIITESAENEQLKKQCFEKERKLKVQEALLPHKKKGSKFVTYDTKNKQYKIRIPSALRKDNRSKITASSEQETYDRMYAYLFGENNHTIRALYDTALESKRTDLDISSLTIDRYQQLWNKYYDHSTIAEQSIKDIKASELKLFFKKICAGRTLSRKAFNNVKSIMNMVYDLAVESDILTDNLSRSLNCKDLKFKAVDNSNKRYTDEDRDAILEVLKAMKHKSGYEYGIELMFCLCIRIGELKALKWSDIDFRKNTIKISREVVLRKDSDGINRPVELNHTKGGEHGERILPLSDRVLHILKCLREQPIVYEHIVCTAEGNPLNTGHFNDHLKRITAKAGVTYMSSHKIRFWSVTALARATGGDLQTVMYAAGHVDKNTTLHYIRAVQQDTKMNDIKACFS
ncbi:Site-specific recombinase XerD [Butyrivibrio sp. ob235]|uniref:tyrosine-type recombinase/integrase n=1 Tax=Butyrivibrio sp. ob235 TaxID=1761780 RepID=UPI0008BF8846|nr:tyrosine-type recombinase/integrase [Butyrivibrio sp. ob235]SEK64831.1 Site-specific recombinase XerD [Butyrivibrio sp. ob235]